MGVLGWLQENWFTFLQSAGIVGGFIFTAASLRSESRAKRVRNLLTVTQQHREIWSQLYQRPELSRVLDPRANVEERPITDTESLFVRLLILHLSSSYHAMKDGVFIRPEGVRRDIGWFFALPVPREVWKIWRAFQDREFVAYVDGCLAEASREGKTTDACQTPCHEA